MECLCSFVDKRSEVRNKFGNKNSYEKKKQIQADCGGKCLSTVSKRDSIR